MYQHAETGGLDTEGARCAPAGDEEGAVEDAMAGATAD
jgi:hypothetical protein